MSYGPRQEPNDELDEPVLAPFAPVPQPGDSDEGRATADEDAHGAERRVAVNACHAPTRHRAADIKTTNMATARRIAIQYAAEQRTAERFAAARSPRLPQWTSSERRRRHWPAIAPRQSGWRFSRRQVRARASSSLTAPPSP